MSKRIFIVDDSRVMRRLLRTYLENRLEHIVCSEAADGLEAIQSAGEVKPDLIVLDLCMPIMNGLEAASVLHDMLPGVPIILFTMHKEIVSEKQARAAGIRAVISKTDQIDLLLNEISNVVGVARAVSA